MSNLEPQASKPSYFRQRMGLLADFVYSPEAGAILAEGAIHPARALVIRAILATPGLPEFLHDVTRLADYRKAGFNILGAGYQAITVSDGSKEVRKFYRHTGDMTEAEQVGRIDSWNAKQALTLEHLGAFAVPQAFDIDVHPLDPNKSLVVARQERIFSTHAINLFDPNPVPDSAREFLVQSKAMPHISDTAAVPDLIGRKNAVIEAKTGAIKLIDPIALVRDDPAETGSYERVVELLDQYDLTS